MEHEIEIVVIEDEEDILELVEYHLLREGYHVTGFLSTENVIRFLEEETPQLMVVDRNLPGVEGSDFVEKIREAGHDIPVIFLSAKNSEDDLERGFSVGGDDYISKPFNPKELVLRIQAVLKRSGVRINDKIRHRDMLLDLKKRELYMNNRRIDLTNLEFKLLYTFAKTPNQAVARDFLRDQVWGEDSETFHEKTINVAINRLRRKIDPDGTKEYFLPVWGIGYKLV